MEEETENKLSVGHIKFFHTWKTLFGDGPPFHHSQENRAMAP